MPKNQNQVNPDLVRQEIEKGRMGGEHLNTACVPSKAILAAGRRAEAFRNPAPREELRGFPHRQAHAGIEQRRVDELATAGARAIVQRREDAAQREQPGAEIGERQAGLHRRSIGAAGNRHDAGGALRDEIESALLRIGARRPVAGDRRVDQRGMLG